MKTCDMIWIEFNEDRILTYIQKHYNWCLLNIIRNPIFEKVILNVHSLDISLHNG
jgi:hypothetical protein